MNKRTFIKSACITAAMVVTGAGIFGNRSQLSQDEIVRQLQEGCGDGDSFLVKWYNQSGDKNFPAISSRRLQLRGKPIMRVQFADGSQRDIV